jgi:hypothetical protein
VPKDTARFQGLLAEDEGCWPPEENFHSYWLADSRIVALSTRGDSAFANVDILSVARQVPESGSAYGSVVTRHVEQDTVELLLIRDGPANEWRICGDTREGWDFGSYGLPRNVTYRPAGTTKSNLYKLVDSVRDARR